MPRQIEVPDSPTMKQVPLEVGTGTGDDRKTSEFSAQFPASLADAIAFEGEKGVFKRYVQNLVIEKQNEERRRIASTGEESSRSRAKWADELGL